MFINEKGTVLPNKMLYSLGHATTNLTRSGPAWSDGRQSDEIVCATSRRKETSIFDKFGDNTPFYF